MDLAPILLAAALVVVALGGALVLRSRRPGTRRHGTGTGIAVRFTPHALERMGERRVTEGDVRRAIAAPDRVVSTTYVDLSARGAETDGGADRASVRLEKDLRGRTLKVWVPPGWESEVPVAIKSVAWQYSVTVRVPRGRAGAIIGRGGQTIRELEQTYDVRIRVDGGLGLARIVGDDEDAVARARRHIARLIA